MAEWSFLTNHGLVLTYIGRHPDSTGREIAHAVGITERAVRSIVTDLRAAGYLEPEKVGRRNRYRINTSQPLRHLGERSITVRELLELLWRDKDRTVENERMVTGLSPGRAEMPSP
ncbi:MAG TPA: winged helix-turn-helix transcriptional regulator [Chloroflexota bacterium]|jgi:predicted transcriptional regulator|nr:winged helix-turn-helix transcriptional regulator [Chloroflexota bacterium]